MSLSHITPSVHSCLSITMYRLRFSLVILILIPNLQSVLSARILGVFPIPSISHQVVFRAFTQELARRGHELVIITPDPALPKDRPKDNVTEIDVSFSYPFVAEEVGKIDIFQKGVIADVNTVSFYLYNVFLKVIKKQVTSEEVQKLIEDKNQKFDLIVTEAYFSLPLIFSHIFKAPVIQFSSFHGLPENYETVGALGSHPFYYPNFNRNKFKNLTFWETILELYYELKLRYEFYLVAREEDRIIKELFGPEAPTIDILKDNVNMLLVNTHPIFGDNRPVPPSVVYLGALHLQPVKELPKDLKHYLDNSKTGVVYVSLGSNVLPSRMDKDLLYNFIKAFEALPYDILWKFDVENLGPLPNNVKTQKWFPQRDLLVHPKIKVFVTQGGLQSTDEAIESGVPLVGIPMLGDQFHNTNKYVELGIGLQLDAMTFTPEDLVQAVKTVFEGDSFRNNIRRLKSVMRDQPQTPLERAVWWTEHVLRHSGAAHLRASAANISWAEYLMLDILIPMFLILFVGIFVTCKVICLVCRSMFSKKVKLKAN